MSTIEHCSWVTETNEREFSEPVAAEMAERGIAVCPTINVNAPYVAELTGMAVGESVKRMYDLGVRIIAGTDAGVDNTPHHQYAGGLAAMVTLLGFSPADVIAMATTEAAAALGLGAVDRTAGPGLRRGPHRGGRRPARPTSRRSAGCAGSWPGAATTCRTAAASTSARPARRSPTLEHPVDLRLLTEATRRRRA